MITIVMIIMTMKIIMIITIIMIKQVRDQPRFHPSGRPHQLDDRCRLEHCGGKEEADTGDYLSDTDDALDLVKDTVHWTFLPILPSIVCLGDSDVADDSDAGDLDNTNLNCDVLDGHDKDNLGCG